jgi:hypothetical protein
MTEYIEREANCKKCIHYDVCYHIEHYGRELETDEPCKQFKSIANMVEVKHGEWKERFAYDSWHYDCPFCDFGFATKIRQEDTPNYCEHCGAKMSLN